MQTHNTPAIFFDGRYDAVGRFVRQSRPISRAFAGPRADGSSERGGGATKEKRFLFFSLLMSSAGQYFSHARIDPLTDAETKEIDSGRCEMSGISSGRGSRQGAAADSYRNVPQVSTREISMEMFQNEKHREPERVGE